MQNTLQSTKGAHDSVMMGMKNTAPSTILNSKLDNTIMNEYLDVKMPETTAMTKKPSMVRNFYSKEHHTTAALKVEGTAHKRNMT